MGGVLFDVFCYFFDCVVVGGFEGAFCGLEDFCDFAVF